MDLTGQLSNRAFQGLLQSLTASAKLGDVEPLETVLDYMSGIAAFSEASGA